MASCTYASQAWIIKLCKLKACRVPHFIHSSSRLRELTCRKGPHSLICHEREGHFRLTAAETLWTPERRMAELAWSLVLVSCSRILRYDRDCPRLWLQCHGWDSNSGKYSGSPWGNILYAIAPLLGCTYVGEPHFLFEAKRLQHKTKQWKHVFLNKHWTRPFLDTPTHYREVRLNLPSEVSIGKRSQMIKSKEVLW